MRRALAALVLIAVAPACRDRALASRESERNAKDALCAAQHGIPHVLLAYHDHRLTKEQAMVGFAKVRETIEENASGRYESHLRDVATAMRVFTIVTMHRGDTNDAYRDLRTLRESLPRLRDCPQVYAKARSKDR
jgi:hypothetical protein